MTKTVTKAKKSTPTPSVATAPNRQLMQTHELVLSPTIQSAVGIHAWSKFMGQADLADLVTDLREQVKKVQGGDMGSVEAMLYGQAMTLGTIFTSLARKAVAQEYLKQFQVNLTLALKAQAQCRATLEALAEIKNPRPVAFVKQANISGGPQQVNNGALVNSVPHHSSHASENTDPENKLLERAADGNYHLDTGAQGKAGCADPHLEAVAAGQRTAHP